MYDLIQFMLKKQDKILVMIAQHCEMVIISMAISIVLGITVGYLITYNKRVANGVLYIAGVMMTIPSLALFSFLAPLMGLNMKPVITGLVAYTLMPIIRNTYIGLTGIDASVISSAEGMGLTQMEITAKVRIPLALPVIMAGIRTSVVMGIGITTISAFVGEGGLGVYIFQGINRDNIHMILTSAILIAVITIAVDKVLQLVQKVMERNVR